MPNEGENKPEEKKVTNKKKAKAVKNLPPADKEQEKPNTVPTITPEIQKMIQQAFVQFYDTVSVENARKVDINHFHNISKEYLKCYITLGYDLNDNRIFLMHADNMKDRDALLENLRFVFFNMMNNQANSGGAGGDMDEMY